MWLEQSLVDEVIFVSTALAHADTESCNNNATGKFNGTRPESRKDFSTLSTD